MEETNAEVTNEPVIVINDNAISEILQKQDARRVSPFEVTQLEKDAKRNWDIFYKRNETRFFKDRHWSLREFQEILSWKPQTNQSFSQSEVLKIEDKSGCKLSLSTPSVCPVLLEVGCGCGNFVYPILEEVPHLQIYACDFSPRAVDFVKSHPSYNSSNIKAFVCDITDEECFSKHHKLMQEKTDFVSLIFVLSAITPVIQYKAIDHIAQVMKPGSIVFFRDYGRYDMAQLRFKGGKKIDENFYARRDGTRAYYFTPDEVELLFTKNGQFTKLQCEFVHRRTVNVKENIDVGRIFVQGKFIKT